MAEGTKSPTQLERISSEVHDAWVAWTKHIQRRVKPVWRERWKKLFVDYDELPEVEKEKDRKFARRIQKVIKKSDDYAEVPESYAQQLGRELGLGSDVPLVQFREGIAMEDEEHGGEMGPNTDVTGGSRRRAGQIALAHLREDPHYYTKLEEMEGKSEPAPWSDRRRRMQERRDPDGLERSPGQGEEMTAKGAAYRLGRLLASPIS